MKRFAIALSLTLPLAGLFVVQVEPVAQAPARDPGLRSGADAGGAIVAQTAPEFLLFTAGKEDFEETEGVGDGLGPRMNLDSCAGCHLQPATGGSSPPNNPQNAFAKAVSPSQLGKVASFVKQNGPVVEVRFKFKPDGTPDGGVHALFVISNRSDETGTASGCPISQENFAPEIAHGNAIFRIPTPVFGAGLIEAIPDTKILEGATTKQFGITGRTNIVSGGTVGRFGWKAQHAKLLDFAAEAYNVEMGITNDLNQFTRTELDPAGALNGPCDFKHQVPNDPGAADDAIHKFANFMRLLAAPTPSIATPGGSASILRGRLLFDAPPTGVGCALCHTPTLMTGASTVTALSSQPVKLYSDLLIHNMGPGLADGITQGQAGGADFRTAPLWGLGQRIFFLHDGRTTDLIAAIRAHGGEATPVVNLFNARTEAEKQDLLNFLRSL